MSLVAAGVLIASLKDLLSNNIEILIETNATLTIFGSSCLGARCVAQMVIFVTQLERFHEVLQLLHITHTVLFKLMPPEPGVTHAITRRPLHHQLLHDRLQVLLSVSQRACVVLGPETV